MEASEGYLSPSFHVPKPHNRLVPRLVIDYSKVNNIIRRPGQVTPNVESVLHQINGPTPTYWLVLDLTQAYWQIPISPDSEKYTVFICEEGKFVWTVLPMGLRNSRDDFLRKTDQIFRDGDLSGYIKCFDDVGIHATPWRSFAKDSKSSS